MSGPSVSAPVPPKDTCWGLWNTKTARRLAVQFGTRPQSTASPAQPRQKVRVAQSVESGFLIIRTDPSATRAEQRTSGVSSPSVFLIWPTRDTSATYLPARRIHIPMPRARFHNHPSPLLRGCCATVVLRQKCTAGNQLQERWLRIKGGSRAAKVQRYDNMISLAKCVGRAIMGWSRGYCPAPSPIRGEPRRITMPTFKGATA